MRLNLLSEETKNDKIKYTELVCMMAQCRLESSVHRFLIYKKAKIACKNIKNFITALVFLKKMLSLEKEVKILYLNIIIIFS
jgi:hypothetical protein